MSESPDYSIVTDYHWRAVREEFAKFGREPTLNDAYNLALDAQAILYGSQLKQQLYDEASLARSQDTQNEMNEPPPSVEAEPAATDPPPYVTPHIAMMLEALRHYEITDDWCPKKDELVDHFKKLRLPDGSPISAAQAEYMATFCRPPKAMKGGNKRS